jgi:LacI family transcriptional regulator
MIFHMAEKKKTTIYEVAKEAGVSRQTISRVLNNRPDVAPVTRKHVQDIIQRMEYHPSAIARSLSAKKSHILGVVTAGLIYAGPSRTLSGITGKAEELGYGLLLKELTSYSSNNIHPLIQWFQAHQVDGIIWAAPEIGDNRYWLKDWLKEIQIPIIFLTMGKRDEVSIVAIDNYQGARLATEHLISLGRKKVGHISGPLSWWEARQRKKGWEDSLSDAGIQVFDNMWTEGNWSSKSGKLAFEQLLQTFPNMDAVFVGNDQMALSVMQTAFEQGRQIPDDLAIVGFDGIPEAEFFCPALSTVYQNQNELGCIAVQELVRIIETNRLLKTQSEAIVTLVKPQLIVRASSLPT